MAEYNEEFDRLRRNRVQVSYHKYGPEQDVYRAHMDAELRQIMRDRADQLLPFERRYPELKTPTYGERRR